MSKLPKPVYLAAGAYTVSLGPGRPEFHPRKPRPGLEHYLKEAGLAALAQTAGATAIDEGVVGNFMAARFNKQGHLGALMPMIDPALVGKPMLRTEGACASGGLALVSGIKSVLSGLAESVLVMGVEVQNTVKAVYGADILGGAGWIAGERKDGPAFFFPGKFSERAGAYKAKFGADRTHEAMAAWYAAAVEAARRNPLAQEHTNAARDLMKVGKAPCDAASFCEHLNLAHCSKVSDGAAAIVVCSAEGLARLGIDRRDAVELVGLGHVVADLTAPPDDLAALSTSRRATAHAKAMAGIGNDAIGVTEVHDCFSITGILSLEALDYAAPGAGVDLVLGGETLPGGRFPTNTSGGLVGYGHPTGATGVRMAVDLWKQLTGRGGDAQMSLKGDHGVLINMGGNDKTAVSLVLRR